jgi:hypothetical protein
MCCGGSLKKQFCTNALNVTLNQHIASCPQCVHSSYLYRYPAMDVLSPISRRLGRLRRQNLGRNHAARDTTVRHRTWKTVRIERLKIRR